MKITQLELILYFIYLDKTHLLKLNYFQSFILREYNLKTLKVTWNTLIFKIFHFFIRIKKSISCWSLCLCKQTTSPIVIVINGRFAMWAFHKAQVFTISTFQHVRSFTDRLWMKFMMNKAFKTPDFLTWTLWNDNVKYLI